MNFTANTDEKILQLYNTITLLLLKKTQGYSLYPSASTASTVRSDLRPIPDIWFNHKSFVRRYNKLLKDYYEQTTAPKKSVVDKYYTDVAEPERVVNKVYPARILYEITPFGVGNTAVIDYEYYNYVYTGCKADYTELNNITKEIIAERSKFFKNKKKIAELIEKHKAVRKTLNAPCNNLPKTATDRVFLKSFDSKSNGSKYSCEITRNLFLSSIGYINLPPYFFNDSLYDLKNKDYLKYNTKCTIHLVPEASIAYITSSLEADKNSKTFFKQGVTEYDVLENVKKQAVYEKKFIEKFNLEFICNLFNEKIKAKASTKETEVSKLTIKLPYLGLDKLTEEELGEVATRIYNHFLLYERYSSYAYYYNKPSTDPTSVENLVASLPRGYSDIPYINDYKGAIDSGRFNTYYEVCAYVDNIRRQDELNNRIRKIEGNQQAILKQNQNIIANQNKLYLQKEKHHNETMNKLKDIERSIDSIETEVTIYL